MDNGGQGKFDEIVALLGDYICTSFTGFRYIGYSERMSWQGGRTGIGGRRTVIKYKMSEK